jgi:hypothetical protein
MATNSKKEDISNLDVPKGALTYGSLIYLTFTEENLTEYVAYSEGLTKTKILLKTRDEFEKQSMYMKGLFRIYPSFFQNEYTKGKNKFEEILEARNANQSNTRGKSHLI